MYVDRWTDDSTIEEGWLERRPVRAARWPLLPRSLCARALLSPRAPARRAAYTGRSCGRMICIFGIGIAVLR